MRNFAIRRWILIVILSSASVLLILLAARSDRKDTLGIDLDDRESLGDYYVEVPANENDGLYGDVKSITFEDEPEVLYLLLPMDVDFSKVVCYLKNANDEYATRTEFNLEEDIEVAGKTIKSVQCKLPMLFLYFDDKQAYRDMCNDETKETESYCDMVLGMDEVTSKQQKCKPVYKFISEEDRQNSVTLRGRGNGTWVASRKKPFSIFLSEPADLLGMGSSKKWNLLANANDKTLLKNYCFEKMADEVGLEFTPKVNNVELFINGNYEGIYMLTSKIDVGRNRINIGNGDFLINWGASSDEQRIDYESDSWVNGDNGDEPYVNLEWPEFDERIEEKQEIIQRFIDAIEDTGCENYTDYCDVNSMVKYYWVEEIAMNCDAWFRSCYSYYKASTGKIYMGPVWDMDNTIGTNLEFEGIDFANPKEWKVRELGWYEPLFERDDFRIAVTDTYYDGGIRDCMMAAYDDFANMASCMEEEAGLDYRLWQDEWTSDAIQYEADSYAEYVDATLDFFKQRIEWIDNEMQREESDRDD